jgi:hypothetical protein
VCSLEGGAPEGGVPKPQENARVWEPPLNINNSLLISSLFSCFIEKKYLHGNVGTYKIGEFPWYNALGFFWWGRFLKIHIEIKKGSCFMYLQ